MSFIVKKLIDALKWITIFIMLVLLAALTWQVISRYVLKDPSTITEELARLLLMWLGLLGSSLGFLLRKHLSFDTLVENAKPKTRRLLFDISDYTVVLFGLLLLIGGTLVVYKTWMLGQTSPILGLSYSLVYAVLPISGAIICLAPFAPVPSVMTEPEVPRAN
ncbi:MAG: TRAP transporter small permease subunit [Bdellovibrionota bacterium]